MFHFLGRFILIAYVFFIFLIQSSTSSSLENDKQAQLIERLDRMQSKMDAENEKLIERLNKMQTKMDIENDKWTRKFGELEAENEKLKAQKLQLEEELQNPKSQISDQQIFIPTPKRDGEQSSRVSNSPISCQQLKYYNAVYLIDGLYLMKNNGKIQLVFCAFPSNYDAYQELIGQVGVKTNIIHFYAQRSSSLNMPKGGTITFDLIRLNEGGAFDSSSGTFTVPVDGIYHFDFSGLKASSSEYLEINLKVDKDIVGSTASTIKASYSAVSLSASLRLTKGNKVSLYSKDGNVFDDSRHFTQFNGWLVEEDLM